MKKFLTKKFVIAFISIIVITTISLLFWNYSSTKNSEIQALKQANNDLTSKVILEHAIYTNYVAYSDSVSAEKQKQIDGLNKEKENLGILVKETELSKQKLYSSLFCKLFNDIKPEFSYRSNEAVLAELENRYRLAHPNEKITERFFKKVFSNSEMAIHTLVIGDLNMKEEYVVTYEEPDLHNKKSVYVIGSGCFLDYPDIDVLLNPLNQ